jgi:HK97 family phage major capsid protein
MPAATDAMKSEARKGLEWRKEFKRGGTEIGVARARDIVNGADLSASTIARMVSYFARHEVDKKAEGWSPGEKGYPSAGRIAWALWGGDPGKSWAEKEHAKMNQSVKNSVMTEMVLDAIKTSVLENRPVKIDLTEASALTASGSGKGGNVVFDDAFSALRYANPFRMGSRVIPVNGSDALFVAKTGNATNSTPWGYTPANNTGSPNIDTSIWQLPVRDISAIVPIRTAALSDINNLEATLVQDLMLEFSAVEGASMAVNDDQAGSTTTATGATNGLRGLNMYLDGAASAYGTSGTAITNGIHTIATQTATTSITYADLTAAVGKFPGQYWMLPGTAWHVRPQTIQALRDLKDLQNLPLLLEVGDDSGAVGRMFGFPVIANPYLSASYPIYLANWPLFLTIGDAMEMTIQMMEQTAPGFTTMYAEKRVVSSVRDPFAGVRIKV